MSILCFTIIWCQAGSGLVGDCCLMPNEQFLQWGLLGYYTENLTVDHSECTLTA
jgi:hypothetical protein